MSTYNQQGVRIWPALSALRGKTLSLVKTASTNLPSSSRVQLDSQLLPLANVLNWGRRAKLLKGACRDAESILGVIDSGDGRSGRLVTPVAPRV
jgi:hypothetical protein